MYYWEYRVTIRQVEFDSEYLTSHWVIIGLMENLDLLIAKFKEVKEELQKSDSPSNDTEGLDKAYVSPYYTHGPSKPVAKPAAAPAKPARLTGLDRIKQVSQETIQPTSVQSKGKPASAPAAAAPAAPAKPKLTGMDRIRAEAAKPIESMTSKVKKEEDEDEDDVEKKEDLEKGLFGMGSAPAGEKKSFTPSFKGHSAALGVGAKTNAKGVTTERSFDPLKQQTSQKKFISMPFGKTVNGSYSPQANESGMAMSADEKLTLNKGGQWGLEKNLQDAIKQLKSSTKVTSAMNSMRSANPGMPKPAAAPAPVLKDEAGDHCSKCGKKPCTCIKTTGVLVDKMDGSDMSGSGC